MAITERDKRIAKAREEMGLPIKDYEYLIHHINNDEGKDLIYHCMLYDHIGNMFEIDHMEIKNGQAKTGNRKIADGSYHVVTRLEPTQEVAWSDEEAQKGGITPKRMSPGMSLQKKAKEW